MGNSSSFNEKLEQKRIEREKRLGLYVGSRPQYTNSYYNNYAPRPPPHMLSRPVGNIKPPSPSNFQRGSVSSSMSSSRQNSTQLSKKPSERGVKIVDNKGGQPSFLTWTAPSESTRAEFDASHILAPVRRAVRSCTPPPDDDNFHSTNSENIPGVKLREERKTEKESPLLRQLLVLLSTEELEERTTLMLEERNSFGSITELFDYYSFLESIREAAFELFYLERCARKNVKKQESRERNFLIFWSQENYSDALMSKQFRKLERESSARRSRSLSGSLPNNKPRFVVSKVRTKSSSVESPSENYQRFIPPTSTKYDRGNLGSNDGLGAEEVRDFVDFDDGSEYPSDQPFKKKFPNEKGSTYAIRDSNDRTDKIRKESPSPRRKHREESYPPPRRLFHSEKADATEVVVNNSHQYKRKYYSPYSVT